MIFLKRYRTYIKKYLYYSEHCWLSVSRIIITEFSYSYKSSITQKTRYKYEMLTYELCGDKYRYNYANPSNTNLYDAHSELFTLYYDRRSFVHNCSIHHTIEQVECKNKSGNRIIIRNIHCNKPKFALKKHIKRTRANYFRNIQTIIYVNQTQRTITLGRLRI